MSISAEWVQLGKNKKGKQVFYRKKEIYDMEWAQKGIHISDCMIASARFGGPIALTRHPRRATRLQGDQKPYISIYTSSGHLISKFIWNSNKKGSLMHMGWSDQESLLCVTDLGYVFVYDIHGKLLKPFSFPGEVTDCGLIKCATWGNGVAALTKNAEVWVASDIERPFCEKLADIPKALAENLDEDADVSLEVIPPEISVYSTVDVLIGLPNAKSILVVNSDECITMELPNGPFKRISASPSGEAIATFTESGGLWVVKSDFSENHAEFNTKSKAPPHQLAWCGEDSVCLSWIPEQLNRPNSLLLMIGPNGDYNKFIYDGPIHLITECDGVRVITDTTCEFLQRVPSTTNEIFRLGSLEPGAMLYDAFKEFDKQNAASIRNIRGIKEKEQLEKAVRTCLQAACHEFDPSLQRMLLKAAAYGKSFCENFDHSEFINTLKKLRVLNAVRNFEVGIPLTSKQYETLTPEVLIDRLVNRFHHLLAYRVCQYLDMKSENVLVHWACAKVRSEEPETAILDAIKTKLQQCEGASYAVVASTAYRVGKKKLAIDLLDFEKNAGEQVPLLLDMGETKKALKKAIESGETDLVYLVLLQMKKKLAPQALFSIINEPSFEVARNLLVTYCKEQDIDFLTTFYQALELPHEAASMLVLESYKVEDIAMKKKLLKSSKELFSKKKESYVDAGAAEDELNLLQEQLELDEAVGKKMFTGLSISETIYNCILTGQTKRASTLKDAFKVPDKRYYWIKIRALAKMQRWDDLEKFAKAKKSPIGYRPFVEVCLEYDSYKVQAAKYITKVTDAWDKVELYVAMVKFKEAIETAYAERNVEMLQWIRTKSTNAQTRGTIENLLQKLGA